MSASTVPAFAYTCEFCRQPLPQDQSKWGHVSVPFGGQDDSDCTFWCAECWEKVRPKTVPCEVCGEHGDCPGITNCQACQGTGKQLLIDSNDPFADE